MCLNPVRLLNGNEVACHKCSQCVERKIDDWTGRCIAESKTSAFTHSVTLTYGRDDLYNTVDHVRAAVLTYSDVQQYLRSWRDYQSDKVPNGFPVRYFIVGEYGSMKGRAHWHCLLFWQGPRWPHRVLDTNIDDPMWKHGHSFWQMATEKTVRYVTKYISKEVESKERQYHKGLSRKPPLGDAFFRKLAEQHIEQRLAPQDLFYSFPEVVDRQGKPKRYMMQGVTAENFLRYFRDGWQERYQDHAPGSEILEAFEDREARRGTQKTSRDLIAMEKVDPSTRRHTLRSSVVQFTGKVRKPQTSDLRDWMKADRVFFNDALNVWYYKFEGGQAPWYWSMDRDGVWQWRARIGEGFEGTRSRYNRAG